MASIASVKCVLTRTSVISVELTPQLAKQWYLSEIIDHDPFQKEIPCFYRQTIKELELLAS